jgi:hypothetical protein
MISSQILSGFNADGDYKNKRIKTMKKNLAEEFFFQSHPFSDLVLLVQGISNEMYSKKKPIFLDKELYVDKSVLAAGSKVFQSYFQDENIDSIEILDVTPNEMIELLQFLYPQFHCTINNQNVTILLILGRNIFKLNLKKNILIF